MTSLTTTRPADTAPAAVVEQEETRVSSGQAPARLTRYDRLVIARAGIVADVGTGDQCRAALGDLLITIARMDGTR